MISVIINVKKVQVECFGADTIHTYMSMTFKWVWKTEHIWHINPNMAVNMTSDFVDYSLDRLKITIILGFSN